MKNVVFDVSGMSCGNCVRHVTQAVGSLPGVQLRAVSVGAADVSYDEKQTTPAAIAQVISDAGYPARERAAGVQDRLACRGDAGQGGGCCCG